MTLMNGVVALLSVSTLLGRHVVVGQRNTCFQQNFFSGGCSDPVCEESICRNNPLCCDDRWTYSCISFAFEDYDACQENRPVSENSCFDFDYENAGWGCNDPECMNRVCLVDSSCCEFFWGDSCVDEAFNQGCDRTGNQGSCFESTRAQLGCGDPVCEEIVCNQRPDCCVETDGDRLNNVYNFECANIARESCEFPPPENSCFAASITPNCTDTVCLDLVCNEFSECCTLRYSSLCIEIALEMCDYEPINSCFEPNLYATNCSDPVCLDAVCAVDSTCCTDGNSNNYDFQCVGIAREMGDSCQFPEVNNSCTEESDFGGCVDVTCQDLVCEIGSDCCNNATHAGTWDSICVSMARTICFPDVIPRPPGGDCPLGFICDEVNMSNCTEVRSAAVEMYQIGDIYAGVYCPEGSDNMINCPKGMYCETPQDMAMCPSGYYCSYKTAKPEIKCLQCGEGATQYERDKYGWVVFGLIFALAIFFIVVVLMKRYNKELIYKFNDLQQRQTDSIRLYVNRKKRQQDQLERIRPQLTLISMRVASLEASQHGDSENKLRSSQATLVTGDKVVFDARKLFDTIDVDSSGDVSFSELNQILELNPIQLTDFVRRMNELAGVSVEADCVTRPTFVKYFLQVLEETSHLNVSPDEAGLIFDEIAAQETSKDGSVSPSNFFTSSMSNYLTDAQINELVKKFRTVKRNIASDRIESSRANLLTQFSIRNTSPANASKNVISRAEFVEYYPKFLIAITVENEPTTRMAMASERHDSDAVDFPGVDICFKDLSLAVKVGDKSVNVVDHITGRVRAKTMTALMGGSGAGKTSLLNALCGRAFYGQVEGEVHLNGQSTAIEEIKDSVGFVPQDDIVYAELTVRENLIFSGRFRLPKGTPANVIGDLADETLANLGLSRVANSLVGDVKRRGVSGGEKKRVNIGLELMANPNMLFLDEPTSGLDASSALLVMKSLKHLVDVQGVTVVSVIHQPRKFIFDLFDSLILLGVGGRMVYHGPTGNALSYFQGLNYSLPLGESVADWLIDISCGRFEPDNQVATTRKLEELQATTADTEVVDGNGDALTPKLSGNRSEVGEVKTPLQEQPEQDTDGLHGTPAVKDADVVGTKGVTTGKASQAFEEAKARRAWLYDEWNKHFEKLTGEDRAIYDIPDIYGLPKPVNKPAFFFQLKFQIKRAFLVAWRNRFSKFVDTALIVGAIIVISLMDGIAKVAGDRDPDIPFEQAVRPRPDDIRSIGINLFSYAAIVKQIEYPLKVGIILAVLVGLKATQIVTDKRIEFFREAGSGYDLNAYYIAINIVASLEHSIQVFIGAYFAFWIRNPIVVWYSFFIHFMLLTWLCVSWALFLPMLVPPDNVTLVVGFFFAFSGLLFCGALPPVTYNDIYSDSATEVFSGWISPTRFFVEAMAVDQYRCYPEQSGFTIEDYAVNFPRQDSTFSAIGLAGNDLGVTERSCNGWYWSVLPAIFVGITVRIAGLGAMHAFNRSKQTKKPLLYVMKKDGKVFWTVLAFFVLFAGLFILTTWFIVRDSTYEANPTMVEELIDFYY